MRVLKAGFRRNDAAPSDALRRKRALIEFVDKAIETLAVGPPCEATLALKEATLALAPLCAPGDPNEEAREGPKRGKKQPWLLASHNPRGTPCEARVASPLRRGPPCF